MSVRWWQWRDGGTYPGKVTFSNLTALATSVQVPADATVGQTIHLILEATDKWQAPADPLSAGDRHRHALRSP